MLDFNFKSARCYKNLSPKLVHIHNIIIPIMTHVPTFQLLALNLWESLGEQTPQSHTRSVELLFQLHQLAPDPWICEDVIGRTLLSDDKVGVRNDATVTSVYLLGISTLDVSC